MKLKNLFIALASFVFVFAACEKEGATSLESIQLDKTYLSIPATGGDAVLNIKASQPWSLAKDILLDKANKVYGELPAWLTASAISGGAGESKITFHADAIDGGREQELHILVGTGESQVTQYLLVRQGSLAAVEATCAEVIAGADGKTFTVTGTVTNIENTTYGNWWLDDGTGLVYIYGTLDKDGKEKNFASLGIENGDVITVQGPKTTYGEKIELVNVTVLDLVKALLKLDKDAFEVSKEGEVITVKAAYKGNGTFVNPKADWISLESMDYVKGTPSKIEPNPADTAVVKLRVAPNESVKPRTGIVTISSENADGSTAMDVTVKQGANAPDLSSIADGVKAGYGHVKGRIMAICKRGYILADETGAFLAYYGSKFKPENYKLGDEIEIIDEFGHYNFGLQMSCDGKDGFILEEKVSEGSGTVTYPTPKVLDKAALAALIESIKGKSSSVENCIPIEYVQLTGTPKKNGNYINIFLDGYTDADFSGYQLPAEFDLNTVLDKKVTIRGYTQSISGGKHVNIVFTEMVEGEAEVPAIEYTDLSTIISLADNAEFTLTGVTAAKGSKGVVVTDGKTGFYVYSPATTPEVGDIVTVTGTKTTFYNLVESKQGAKVTVVESGAAVPELTAKDITSTFDAYPDSEHASEYISFTGTYQTNGKNVNVTVEGASKRTGSLQGSVLDSKYDGKKVKVSGYYIGTSGSGGIYFVLIATKIEQL